MSRLKEALETGKFGVTAEMAPPKGYDFTEQLEAGKLLAPKVHAVNVTDMQSASLKASSLGLCIALKNAGVEPILQMTGRDRNRMAIMADVLSAASFGIDSVLALTGDHPVVGDCKDAKPVYDLDSVGILNMLSKMEQTNCDCGGNEIAGGAPKLYKGASVTPVYEPVFLQINKLRQKVEAGASFVQTQGIFDLDAFKRFLEQVDAAGIKTHVMAGIIPLKSAGMARYMNENVPGIAVPQEMIDRLAAAAEEGKVYNVAYLVNGNLGDKSFFDSAEAGLAQLKADGRIDYVTIEMGGTDEDQPTWLSTLYDVSEDGGYDLIICGTYQMPDYLKEVATQYPDQLYAIFDDTTYVGENKNVVNLSYRQNDMGYLVGVYAACMTVDTNIANINEDAVVGFVGGVDSPVINDFLIGFIEGAQSVNPDIKVDTRYTNDYVDTAIAKEYGLSMINDNQCDIIWGVAGNAGNGAAEAALETGKAWFIGVDSDQELTFSPDLAAITLTSGLKNIGNSLVWLFDEWDAGRTYWGQVVELGIAEGGVGIVTDKNYDKLASAETKAAVEAAQNAILNGEVVVDSALTNQELAVELRDSVRP